jgi:SAM-dependent methyltransferase
MPLMDVDRAKAAWLPTTEEQDVFTNILESRHLVVFPWLVASIMRLAPHSVLDYGGRDGKFLAALREQFAGELWYYDPSAHLAANAERLLRGANVRFSPNPKSLADESMDVVVSVAVWMMLPNHQDCVDYLSEQRRLLRQGGTAFIVMTHPCFREEVYSSFKTAFRNDRYLETGTPFAVEVFDREKGVDFVDYHWNLSAMLRQSNEAELRLAQLTELPDAASGNPRGAPWLCLEFRKD